jgi:2-oxoacid:acceptor oxidoreductase delta subunit (pyruvate/2-ketoisovalerate family)
MNEVDKVKWKNICEDRDKRPEIQQYKNWRELPPIPISLPIEGSIGTTGDWRTYKPIIDIETCTKCGICWMYCPEGTISKNEEGFYEVNFTYCKGCGVCAKECPSKSIEMIRESDSVDG